METYGTRDQADKGARSAAESVVERMYLAIKGLCTAEGDIRERLGDAVMTLIPLGEKAFPEELQPEYRWVMQQSTRFEPDVQGQGSIAATMKRISNSEAKEIATKIFDLYSKVQDIRGFPLLEYRNPND